jgi:hypothetical protein
MSGSRANVHAIPHRFAGTASTAVLNRFVVAQTLTASHGKVDSRRERRLLPRWPPESVDEEALVNRNSTRPVTACTVAGALALAAFAGAAFAAEAGSSTERSTVTTQTTTVSTRATPALAPASKRQGDPDEMRITSLHDKLMIKSSQETLWKDVAEVMRSNDEKMDAVSTERHDKAGTMTAVEDLRSYGEISEQHAIGIKTFAPVFEKLYDSMSVEQKANADKVFRTEVRKTATKAK